MQGRPFLSIVIPAYREASRLPARLKMLHDWAISQPHALEIIFVVDKSPDRTAELIRDFVSRTSFSRCIELETHSGKGAAVRAGMLAALGDPVFFMDADLATDLGEIRRIIQRFSHPSGRVPAVVIGSRTYGKEPQPNRSLFRKALSTLFNFLVRIAVDRRYRDTQCGFKAFRREVVGELFGAQSLDGFAFDVEILMLARRNGIPVREQRVAWSDQPGSTMRPWVHGPLMLLELSYLALRRLLGFRRAKVGKRPIAPLQGFEPAGGSRKTA